MTQQTLAGLGIGQALTTSTPGGQPMSERHAPPPNVVKHPKQSGPRIDPNACRHCGTNHVPCWRCDDHPKHYPLTDQVRHVTHVGICPEHGVITAHCPADTHYTRPAPLPRQPDRGELTRVAAAGLLLGLILGMALGFFGTIGLVATSAIGGSP